MNVVGSAVIIGLLTAWMAIASPIDCSSLGLPDGGQPALCPELTPPHPPFFYLPPLPDPEPPPLPPWAWLPPPSTDPPPPPWTFFEDPSEPPVMDHPEADDTFRGLDPDPSAHTPEPAAFALIGSGLIALGLLGRWRRRLPH